MSASQRIGQFAGQEGGGQDVEFAGCPDDPIPLGEIGGRAHVGRLLMTYCVRVGRSGLRREGRGLGHPQWAQYGYVSPRRFRP
ncbi:hypothetical protein GCM10010326_71860 [Streptomyces xanthochromogenes]|uniref:Uncharacterized protein n=1 Tax=Streptomyces xanthochromogenes TaxID=67384 RepID=A0ABQ3AT18_9ACTN|nr:hypothetical protein GCM10010326_71860 [Streptomyces xanthochromogenes]